MNEQEEREAHEARDMQKEIRKQQQERRFKGLLKFLKASVITLGVVILLVGGCMFIVFRDTFF